MRDLRQPAGAIRWRSGDTSLRVLQQRFVTARDVCRCNHQLTEAIIQAGRLSSRHMNDPTIIQLASHRTAPV
ncbi:hypothetical protein WJX74_004063 [Apatococcus lobatus]|uniref:Uncharacterized protein n=1 Tax=Apatococcus lobatus TaxID=904363 RepID=A0AAW1QK47_9CHLO